MTLNYWMMVERYPNLKEEVGSLKPDYEIFSLRGKLTGWSYASYVLALACWFFFSKKKKEKRIALYIHACCCMM
jgi:hypothetical protein